MQDNTLNTNWTSLETASEVLEAENKPAVVMPDETEIVSDTNADKHEQMIDQLKETTDWFIVLTTPNGEKSGYTRQRLPELANFLVSGELTPQDNVLQYALSAPNGLWTETNPKLQDIIDNTFELGILYQPIAKHAEKGFYWGAIAGIVVKIIILTIVFFAADEKAGFFYLMIFGSFFLSRYLGIMPIVASSVVIAQNSSTFLFTAYGATFGAAISGAILGCLPGLFLGALTGLIRKNSIPKACNTQPESSRKIGLLIIGGLVGSILLYCIYFFIFDPWLMSYLENA